MEGVRLYLSKRFNSNHVGDKCLAVSPTVKPTITCFPTFLSYSKLNKKWTKSNHITKGTFVKLCPVTVKQGNADLKNF